MESKVDLGQSLGTYKQFCVVAREYARFAIPVDLCAIDDLCFKEALSGTVCDLRVIRCFLGYFKIRGAAGTVMYKAFHLLRLCKFAESYFSEINDSTRREQMLSVIEYLQCTARTFKNEYRRQASIRKDKETRMGSGKFLTDSDIAYYGNLG